MTKESQKVVLDRIIYIASVLLLGAVMYLFSSVNRLNTKIDNIVENKDSIQKLWSKFSECKESINECKAKMAGIYIKLGDIDRNTSNIEHLRRFHMQ